MRSRAPEFLNVDLDVESREPLGELADALRLTVMFSTRMRGRYVMSLEGSWPSAALDQTLRRLTKAVSSLSGEPRRLWQRASKRCFNVGVACGSRRAPPFLIASNTIEVLAAVGGSIEMTLYPHAEVRPVPPKHTTRR
jgi:hypothetical protein